MASISVPCPKCTVAPQAAPLARSRAALLAGSARPPLLKVPNRSQFPILKAQIKEIAVENSNSTLVPSTKSGTLDSNGKGPELVEESTGGSTVSDFTIAAFMSEVSDLVKLVDSRDITELQLKQKDCELIIRKKEALQPAPAAPVLMMQPPPHAAYPSPSPLPQAAPSPIPAASTPAPALPPPSKGSKSSLPPLKCPMAGTFYRCSGPGEPPFVKVGDKVKKGQVVCIIEAMKLMNEIEADQSGTVVEVLVEDGKSVSVDMPLFTIEA